MTAEAANTRRYIKFTELKIGQEHVPIQYRQTTTRFGPAIIVDLTILKYTYLPGRVGSQMLNGSIDLRAINNTKYAIRITNTQEAAFDFYPTITPPKEDF